MKSKNKNWDVNTSVNLELKEWNLRYNDRDLQPRKSKLQYKCRNPELKKRNLECNECEWNNLESTAESIIITSVLSAIQAVNPMAEIRKSRAENRN